MEIKQNDLNMELGIAQIQLQLLVGGQKIKTNILEPLRQWIEVCISASFECWGPSRLKFSIVTQLNSCPIRLFIRDTHAEDSGIV